MIALTFADKIEGTHTTKNDFGWPLSVSIQKLTLSWWQENYSYYHLLNFIIHCGNATLVYSLGRKLRLQNTFFYFLLFLIHPIAVISVGWMIQMKTLICFFFALASLLAFLKAHKNLKWMAFSWFLFFLSITSKSASLTLPLIFLALHVRLYKWNKIYLLIPFFLMSAWSGYRVLSSPVTTTGTEKASQTVEKKIIEERPVVEEAPVAKPTKVEVPKVEKAPVEAPVVVATPKEEIPEPPAKLPEPKIEIPSEGKSSFSFIKLNIKLFLQTSHYYFWQSILPVNNVPVKGLNYSDLGAAEYIHIIFLGIITFLLWKDAGLIYLLAAHFLLLPFLGIIPAPFMNVTWVSDQHLYLVLPAFLAFWFRLAERIPWKKNYLLFIFFTLVYSYKTYEATPQYKDQFSFYESSIAYNPYNVPITYNLAFAYIMHGDWNNAYSVVNNCIQMADLVPEMKQNQYYPYVAILYLQMQGGTTNEN